MTTVVAKNGISHLTESDENRRRRLQARRIIRADCEIDLQLVLHLDRSSSGTDRLNAKIGLLDRDGADIRAISPVDRYTDRLNYARATSTYLKQTNYLC
jgi:hypothetical protein